jgi:hypothetical protein
MTQEIPSNEGTKVPSIHERMGNEFDPGRKKAICREEHERMSERTGIPRCDSDTMPETDSEYASEDSSRSLVQNDSKKVRIFHVLSISNMNFSKNLLFIS